MKNFYGSDLIVNILRDYNIEYVSCNPGATFRGIQDSITNSKDRDTPELILCCHEEISVAIAHGYAKASEKFMAVLLHSNVGLQHASMAIFNAWCDRVPMLILGGLGPLDSSKRRPWIDWIHTSNNQGGIIRDYVKWDDQPYNIESTPESLHRACRITNTEPKAPVYVAIDTTIQETQIKKDINTSSPNQYLPPTLAQADNNTLNKIAASLTNAKQPVIIVDRLGRSSKTIPSLLKLANTLSLPIIDCGGRYNFPNTHPLYANGMESEILDKADVVLALDVNDLYHVLSQSKNKNSIDHIFHISMSDYLVSKWSADYQQLCPDVMTITAHTEVALPALIKKCEHIKDKINRNESPPPYLLREKNKKLRQEWKTAAIHPVKNTRMPIPTVINEIWQAIRNEDWILTNYGSLQVYEWIRRLWTLDKAGCHIGGSGGAGLGYGLGASIGAALFHKKEGKLCINVQTDGDFLFTPSALWTVSHYKLPLLIIMINNQSYKNTKEHSIEVANHRNRPTNTANIGSSLTCPTVNFPLLAQSFDIFSLDSVHKPNQIVPAIQKAIRYIKKHNRAALVDILTE